MKRIAMIVASLVMASLPATAKMQQLYDVFDETGKAAVKHSCYYYDHQKNTVLIRFDADNADIQNIQTLVVNMAASVKTFKDYMSLPADDSILQIYGMMEQNCMDEIRIQAAVLKHWAAPEVVVPDNQPIPQLDNTLYSRMTETVKHNKAASEEVGEIFAQEDIACGFANNVDEKPCGHGGGDTSGDGL